jgi:hypothetical protein
VGLRLSVRASQPLSRALHREAELVQEARHVMVVVADAEAALDEVADHRTRPHAARVPGGLRTGLDDRDQRLTLLFVEPRCAPGCSAGEQPLDAHRLVPLQPTVHRAASDIELTGEFDDALALDVTEHRSAATPRIQVRALRRGSDELTELLAGRRATPPGTDRLACLRPRHATQLLAIGRC